MLHSQNDFGLAGSGNEHSMDFTFAVGLPGVFSLAEHQV